MASDRVPKLVGEDMELGNFVQGDDAPGALGNGDRAAHALLREIRGVSPARARSAHAGGYASAGGLYVASGGSAAWSAGAASDPQDLGRKYLPSNGGCAYIDLSHLELCIPEVRSAWDALAAHHALLRVARGALHDANAKLPEGRHIELLANNSDRRGNSYGSHLNVLLTRACWDDLFQRKVHPLLMLAAYQVSSIVFTGQGKVGSERGRAPVPYQISQRADFFEVLTGVQTTYARPIVNSRDEPLCGREGDSELARLHCIFYDNTLCHVATLLKVGVLQVVLAMIEAERVSLDLLLDDPISSVRCWSRDPSLGTRCRLANGEPVTAVELQLRFLDAARRAADAGALDTVPRAEEILALWGDTLRKLEAGAFPELVGRLDWVLKLHALSRTLELRPELDWTAPEIFHLDLLYASLDAERGLYWSYEESGVAERAVEEREILRFLDAPPEDTRAWTRAMLLRHLDPARIDLLDWDRIRVRVPTRSGGSRLAEIRLDDPSDSTRAHSEPLFREAKGLRDLIEALGAEPVDEGRTTPVRITWTH